jgi:hypothetical protein
MEGLCQVTTGHGVFCFSMACSSSLYLACLEREDGPKEEGSLSL